MGDHTVTIVDTGVPIGDASAKAAGLLDWLLTKDIVAQAVTVSALYQRQAETHGWVVPASMLANQRLVHPPGPNWHKACAAPSPMARFPNWLDIQIERQVFDAGGHGIGIFCPSCAAEQTALGDQWSAAIQAWVDAAPDTLVCPVCQFAAGLQDWRFDPVWAFGNLGFRFWNWDLTPAFLTAFQTLIVGPSRVVYTHI